MRSSAWISYFGFDPKTNGLAQLPILPPSVSQMHQDSRAQQAQNLLLNPADAEDTGHDLTWAEEAARRCRGLRETPESGAEEVFLKLRAAVR